VNTNIFTITTPPNTFEQAPRVTPVLLLGRRLAMCSVVFPDGCLYAVGVRIKSYGTFIIPFNVGWIIGNNEHLDFYPNIILEGPSYKVEVETCNYAVDYPHTVNISLEVE
jgi:hypothetical protein